MLLIRIQLYLLYLINQKQDQIYMKFYPIQICLLSYIDIEMAYLARQQSIKSWASLVTTSDVETLKCIQQPGFMIGMLCKLDPTYFERKFKDLLNKPQSQINNKMTVSQIFKEITKYYSSQIGTNIRNIVGDEMNIYSNSSIQQAWELMLGIAIKGNNRENNINTILKMDDKNQEQLMRIVSKVIGMLGQNVSMIHGDMSPQKNGSRSSIQFDQYSDDIFMQLSEQNEQLKEKNDELSNQLHQALENIKTINKQLSTSKKFKKSVFEIMLSYESQISFHSSQILAQGMDNQQASMVSFFKDLIKQAQKSNQEIQRREQKMHIYEETIKDLKLVYSTSLIELQQYRKMYEEITLNFQTQEAQLQELRRQNVDLIDQEKQWLQKIDTLSEQKMNLKTIVQRLQKQSNIPKDQIEELLAIKIKQHKNFEDERIRAEQIQIQKGQIILQQQNHQSKSENQDKTRTIKNQINQVTEPTLRNKLQREVSHLQKKINSLTMQNTSLKKINSVLQKVIRDYTTGAQQAICQLEREYDPIIQELQATINQLLQSSCQYKPLEDIEQKQSEWKKQTQMKIEQLIKNIKAQNDGYKIKDNQFRETIAKLENERDSLLALIQKSNNKESINMQENPIQQNVCQNIVQEYSQAIKVIEPQKQDKKLNKNEAQEENNMKQQKLLIPQVQKVNNKMCSIIIHEEEQEPVLNRRRQYSFMRNVGSFHNAQFDFKQKNYELVGSKIQVGGPSLYRQQSFSKNSLKQQEIQDSQIHQQGSNIIDISEIEEQLQRIKQKFIQINSNKREIYISCLNKAKNCNKDQNVKNSDTNNNNQMIQKMIQKLENTVKKVDNTNLNEVYSAKNIEQSPQFIKIVHQNLSLKNQMMNLIKERNILYRKVQKYSNQTKKQTGVQAQTLINKSHQVLKQVEKIIQENDHEYLKLYNYFNQYLANQNDNNQNKSENYRKYLEMQLIKCKQEMGKNEELIQNLNEQNKILISAMLEWRNQASLYSQSSRIDKKTKNNINKKQ